MRYCGTSKWNNLTTWWGKEEYWYESQERSISCSLPRHPLMSYLQQHLPANALGGTRIFPLTPSLPRARRRLCNAVDAGSIPLYPSLVNRLFHSSPELQITLIQMKRDSSSAKAQLHPPHVLFPGSSGGGCGSVPRAAFCCLPALPRSSFLSLFLSHTPCDPNNLFGDHGVPLLIEQG